MKVLHICPGYLQRQLYDKLISALQYNNVINAVFALSTDNPSFKIENKYKLKILEKKFSIIDRLIYFRKQYIIYRETCKEYSQHEFNVIHAHTLFSAGFSTYLVHKKFKIPYIVSVRNTDINVFFKYMFHLRGLGRIIINNAKNVIFLSPAYRDFVIQKFVSKKNRQIILNKSYVIPNGIDEYFLKNKFTGQRKIDINFIKIIYVGELYPNKNPETTIKVCELLLKKGYNVKFTIVGEILNRRYHEIISKHSFIEYYPKCPKEELVSHLRASDILVMPSIRETFGLVYAEAMSQGLPVIYSIKQGFEGHFENGVVGYAVKSFDYRDISQKIIDLYNNYELFSERCVSLVDRFDWKTIAEQYAKMYGKE